LKHLSGLDRAYRLMDGVVAIGLGALLLLPTFFFR
jgi:hypothetical protein